MDIRQIIQRIRQSARALAQGSFGSYAAQATADAEEFVERLKPDLERWASELAEGEITKDEFESLVEGQRNLAEMLALKEAGLAEAQIHNFQSRILEIIVQETLTGTDSGGPKLRP